jgi:hypothetical protein
MAIPWDRPRRDGGRSQEYDGDALNVEADAVGKPSVIIGLCDCWKRRLYANSRSAGTIFQQFPRAPIRSEGVRLEIIKSLRHDRTNVHGFS